jgi:competence protein ComEC
MLSPSSFFWHKAPFVRLLPALIAGIVLEWQWQIPLFAVRFVFSVCLFLLVLYFFLPLKTKFRLSALNGVAIHFLIASLGSLLLWLQDTRHKTSWFGHSYRSGSYVLATIEEPPVEKANSYKSLASVNYIYNNHEPEAASGLIVLYFKKDSFFRPPAYGARVLFRISLQEIRNSGNPGSFEYKEYSLFQGITHQVFLSVRDCELLPFENGSRLTRFIFKSRQWVVNTLQGFISGEKEQGLAEALLIGYKDDLDKNLVQSYTNTGVVHIIAISGMHLALIYALLVWLTQPIKKYKKLNWIRIFLILAGLWLFTLLAGAQASVVRSAVMFTCIAAGEGLSRRTSVYNTLALSAFLLLCYDPYWLWDVGFQLSYAAVLSILVFYRPVYNWFYLPNKVLDFFWKTMAVSLAAQVLTTPVSLYHFHQFPVLFLLTNLVAVPLSSLILFGEILLCALAWLTPVARLTGRITGLGIQLMNSYIERIEKISFSVWNGFSITMPQAVLLTMAMTLGCFWLMEKKKWMFWLGSASLFAFICLRSVSFFSAYRQNKLIVYNVPRHRAVDLIAGRYYSFVGDADLEKDDFTQNFYLRPARILYRIRQKQLLPASCRNFEFAKRQFVILDSTTALKTLEPKPVLDVLILSKNPQLTISDLLRAFRIQQIVVDGSVPFRKAKQWKKDCDSLNIPCYDVAEKGAFVMNL